MLGKIKPCFFFLGRNSYWQYQVNYFKEDKAHNGSIDNYN